VLSGHPRAVHEYRDHLHVRPFERTLDLASYKVDGIVEPAATARMSGSSWNFDGGPVG
jgi:hypothetical protein